MMQIAGILYFPKILFAPSIPNSRLEFEIPFELVFVCLGILYESLVRQEGKTRKDPYFKGAILTVWICLLKVLSVKNIPYTQQILE